MVLPLSVSRVRPSAPMHTQASPILHPHPKCRGHPKFEYLRVGCVNLDLRKEEKGDVFTITFSTLLEAVSAKRLLHRALGVFIRSHALSMPATVTHNSSRVILESSSKDYKIHTSKIFTFVLHKCISLVFSIPTCSCTYIEAAMIGNFGSICRYSYSTYILISLVVQIIPCWPADNG
eukprot:Gb_18653 [translate_table: standard]